MQNKKYELIIFDCDGTLVDSEPLTNRLIAKMISELGIEIGEEETLHLFAGKTIMHITSYIKDKGVEIDAQKFEDEYRERCLNLFEDELEPIAGVEALIRSLKIPYCVASNGPKKKMDVTLPAAGLDKYFTPERTFSAYDIDHWKPEPHLFWHAAEQMGADPTLCLVVEDTLSGVMGAVNAGIDVMAYNPHLDGRLMIHGVPNYLTMGSIQKEILKSVK